MGAFFVKNFTNVKKYFCYVSSANNYNIIAGSTFVAAQIVTDANGDAVNLTGGTIVTTVVNRNGTELAEITTTSFTDPTAGSYSITIPSATTDTMPMGCYELQSVVTLADSTVFGLEISYLNVNYAVNQ